MLTEAKNQVKIVYLSIKYALMREMLNKFTFIINVLFMILNNASFIVQWVIFFSLKSSIGGYQFKQVLLLWGMASATYGFSHFFFKKAYNLSDIINTGKLDSFLVQPKNVLLSVITTDVEPSAIGDILYGFIMIILYKFTIESVLLFTLLGICGGLIVTSVAVILNSLSFWFHKSDIISETGTGLMVSFATYPDGVFKGIVKILLYTIVPVGLSNYIPVRILINFDFKLVLLVLLFTALFIFFAFFIFFKGLKRYSSSNLMIARM